VSEAEPLVRERRGNVLVVRLDRPEARNALSPALMGALVDTVHEAEADPDVAVVVLTGTGDRAFCAGMDLKAFAAGNVRIDGDDMMRGFARLLDGDVAIPIVGAANASALAGGLELLLGCDVVVASSEAVFGLPEVKRGLIAGGSGTRLGARIPLAAAMEMLLTGDAISAQRAYELGLVNAVVAPHEVLPTALDLAERIAANGPLALAATKELGRLAVTDLSRYAARLVELREAVFTSDDAREGAIAFTEKRAPVWKGR
jgi:enoyl-CoA hydratase